MDPRLEPVLAETNENRRRFEGFCRSLSMAELAAPVEYAEGAACGPDGC